MEETDPCIRDTSDVDAEDVEAPEGAPAEEAAVGLEAASSRRSRLRTALQWGSVLVCGLIVAGLLVIAGSARAGGRVHETSDGMKYQGLEYYHDTDWAGPETAFLETSVRDNVPGHPAKGALRTENPADLPIPRPASPVSVAVSVDANANAGPAPQQQQQQQQQGAAGQAAGQTATASATGEYKVHIKGKKTILSRESGVINLPNRFGQPDAGFVCTSFDLAETIRAPSQVVHIQPHVTHVRRPTAPGTEAGERESVIHHMDMFMCEGSRIRDELQSRDSDYCASAAFVSTQGPCHEMPYAYDKGSGAFSFPSNAGWRVGPGTPYQTMVLAIHYLLPEWWDMHTMMVEDASGFTLTLSTVLRPVNIGTMAFIDEAMTLPPGKPRHEHVVTLPAEQLNLALAKDFAKYKEVRILAVHLHAHNFSTGLWLEHHRDGKKLHDYNRLVPFHGYGPDQSFQMTDVNAAPLRPGDELQFHCVYDTTKAKDTINYGVSHGDEMCGPVIMFHPHDFTQTFELELANKPTGRAADRPS